jgi:hypothetical protein
LFKGITDVNVDVNTSVNIKNDVKISDSNKLSVVPTATTDTTVKVAKTTQETFGTVSLDYSSKSKTITTNLGDKVVDTSLIPYIRSRPINFIAQNLKPSTTLFATFDGIEVTGDCYQSNRMKLVYPFNLPTIAKVRDIVNSQTISEANVIFQRGNVLYIKQNPKTYPFNVSNTITLITGTGSITGQVVSTYGVSENGYITTDELGVATGTFIIPNEEGRRFNIGERAFKLADTTDPRFITTAAETKYLAYGLSTTKEQTVLATRMNLVNINPVLNVRKGESTTSTSERTHSTTVTG